MLGGKCDSAIAVKFGKQVGNFSCAVAKRLGGHFRWAPEVVLATSELRKRPGKSEVDNASWDCFRGRAFCLRPLQQSHDALSTSLLPGLLRNSEVANNAYSMKRKSSFSYLNELLSQFSTRRLFFARSDFFFCLLSSRLELIKNLFNFHNSMSLRAKKIRVVEKRL